MLRREHRKSRNGCARCKRRRVKCDEGIPCRNCLRRGEECDLVAKPVQKAYGQRTCSNCTDSQTTKDVNKDIFLMHHYTLHSSNSLSENKRNKDQLRAFQEWCPQNVDNHPFLLHGMLAVAAFHLAHLNPNDAATWIPRGIRHQSDGLLGFKTTLQNDPTEQNCHALFAQSLLLSISTFASSKYTSSQEQEPSSNALVAATIAPFLHIRGAGDVCLTAYWWIKDGPFAPMLPGNFVRAEGVLTEEVDSRLTALKSLIWEKYAGTALELHLFGATEALRFVFKEAAHAVNVQNNPRYMWKWTNLVNQRYVDSLRDLDPGALVIFAHFALLSGSYSEWFFDGWAERAIGAIHEVLDGEWKDWVDWPKTQLGKGLKVFHVEELNDTPESLESPQVPSKY